MRSSSRCAVQPEVGVPFAEVTEGPPDVATERLSWSPHAHRGTFATVAIEAGILEEIVGRLLNHTLLSITGQRYARPSLDALRPAMTVTCKELKQRTAGAKRPLSG